MTVSKGRAQSDGGPADGMVSGTSLAEQGPSLSIVVAVGRPELVRTVVEAVDRMGGDPGERELILVHEEGVEVEVPVDPATPVRLATCSRRHPNVKRNIGVRLARGALLGFLDDDAKPAETWAAAAQEALGGGELDVTVGPAISSEMDLGSRLARAVTNVPLTSGGGGTPPGPKDRWTRSPATSPTR